MLQIENLHVCVEDQPILNGLSLEINAGQVHAIMGPNGSGKSTLAQVLAGRDDYKVTQGSITFYGKNLLEMQPEERAHLGLFLAFQYPTEIPGVNNAYLLKAALNAQRAARNEQEVDAFEFMNLIKNKMENILLSLTLKNIFRNLKKKNSRLMGHTLEKPKKPLT